MGYRLEKLETKKRMDENFLGIDFEIGTEKGPKRERKRASEIVRHFKCPLSDCPKSYGSEGSLNQHIKLKH